MFVRIPNQEMQMLARAYSSARVKNGRGVIDWPSEKSYQYLQSGPVSTDKFQASLPRLPIPKLEKTCERYLKSQQAILDETAFRKTDALVKDFMLSGKELHQELVARNKENKNTSYINKPWTEMYLKDRKSVSFNHNPGLMLAHDSRESMMRADLRVSSILISSLKFHKSLKNNVLKPDVFHMSPAKTDNDTYWNRVKYMPGMIATPLSYLFKVFPLDMSQHDNLFQSTRIPGKEKDSIQRFPDSKHILVMRKGNFYTFPVYDENWNLFDPAYYIDSIRFIMSDSAPDAGTSGIGVLTSTDRNLWYENREHLMSLGNAEVLKDIDSALFNICLDDDYVHDFNNDTCTLRNLVSGLNPKNRWFDKSFSLIFTANGVFGMNFEHAWGDGVAVMRYVNEVIEDSQRNDYVLDANPTNTEVNVRRLEIKTDEKLAGSVQGAEEAFKAKCATVSFDRIHIEGIGKNLCKTNNIGPDSFMQAVFQVAFHKLSEGKFAPTYESCSTAIHKHGRTETIRPGTMETSALAVALNCSGEKEIKREELLSLLQACSKKHFELTKQCAQGHGWDRHLFAIKALAVEKGVAVPALYEDEAYKNINQIIMSTSTLASEKLINGAFCPVTPEGYGMGYQIRSNQLGVNVSSYNDKTNGKEFCDVLEETFRRLSKCLTSK